MCNAQGQNAEALRFYEEALDINRASCANDHAAVATSLGNMGSVACAQGNFAQAKLWQSEALRVAHSRTCFGLPAPGRCRDVLSERQAR